MWCFVQYILSTLLQNHQSVTSTLPDLLKNCSEFSRRGLILPNTSTLFTLFLANFSCILMHILSFYKIPFAVRNRLQINAEKFNLSVWNKIVQKISFTIENRKSRIFHIVGCLLRMQGCKYWTHQYHSSTKVNVCGTQSGSKLILYFSSTCTKILIPKFRICWWKAFIVQNNWG